MSSRYRAANSKLAERPKESLPRLWHLDWSLASTADVQPDVRSVLPCLAYAGMGGRSIQLSCQQTASPAEQVL